VGENMTKHDQSFIKISSKFSSNCIGFQPLDGHFLHFRQGQVPKKAFRSQHRVGRRKAAEFTEFTAKVKGTSPGGNGHDQMQRHQI